MKSADLQGTTAQEFNWNEYHGTGGIPPSLSDQSGDSVSTELEVAREYYNRQHIYSIMDNLNPTLWIMFHRSWASSQYQERG